MASYFRLERPEFDGESARRSFEVTTHDQSDCDSCKGAAAQQMNHYGLGRLRLTIALELGMTRTGAQDMALAELLERRRAARRPVVA